MSLNIIFFLCDTFPETEVYTELSIEQLEAKVRSKKQLSPTVESEASGQEVSPVTLDLCHNYFKTLILLRSILAPFIIMRGGLQSLSNRSYADLVMAPLHDESAVSLCKTQ